MKSFNEGVEIDFNEETHTYTYEDRKLTSVTAFIKKYIEEFNSEEISYICSDAWHVSQETILNAWDLNRDSTGFFGAGIHKALEYEDLYRNYYKSNGSRCFVIKHPLLKRIVDSFFKLEKRLGFKGEVIPEALVSDVENNICGLADRIIITNKKEKICRIQDYKVNNSFIKEGSCNFINLPKGIDLPPNKLSKLSLQLRMHQVMLEKKGWTVEGLDGFVLENKWIYYKVPMLNNFDIINGLIIK